MKMAGAQAPIAGRLCALTDNPFSLGVPVSVVGETRRDQQPTIAGISRAGSAKPAKTLFRQPIRKGSPGGKVTNSSLALELEALCRTPRRPKEKRLIRSQRLGSCWCPRGRKRRATLFQAPSFFDVCQ